MNKILIFSCLIFLYSNCKAMGENREDTERQALIVRLQNKTPARQFFGDLLAMSKEIVDNPALDVIRKTARSQRNLSRGLALIGNSFATMLIGNYGLRRLLPKMMPTQNPWPLLASSIIAGSIGASMMLSKKYTEFIRRPWNKIPLYQIAKKLPLTSKFPCVRAGIYAEQIQKLRASALINTYQQFDRNCINDMKSLLLYDTIATSEENLLPYYYDTEKDSQYTQSEKLRYRQTALNIISLLPTLATDPFMLQHQAKDHEICNIIQQRKENSEITAAVQALYEYGQEIAHQKNNKARFIYETAAPATATISAIVSTAGTYALANTTRHMLPSWTQTGWQTSGVALGIIIGLGMSNGTKLYKFLFNAIIRHLPFIQQPEPSPNKNTTLKNNVIQQMNKLNTEQQTSIRQIFSFTAHYGYCPLLPTTMLNQLPILDAWEARAALPLI